MKAHAAINTFPRAAEPIAKDTLQENLLSRWFVPRHETQVVAAQQSKGIFLPYPLLAILVTVGALVLSGIVGLYVQVSSLNTTLLLRDADTQRALTRQHERIELLEVYIQNDREKIAKLEAKSEDKRRN